MPQQRTTRQSVAIREAIESAGRPLSIEEILEEASTTVPGIGLRTVYRVVRRLQEENEITTVSVPGGADRYELASVAATHHHHFHCTACDRIYDVAGCAGGLQKLLPKGFHLEHHELTLSGRCATCA
ncbi:MAG: transcriptional repressor [Planctomycetaceae bacterium]|nr:transcriptional repressor [Planctomycetaceae bacterium]